MHRQARVSVTALVVLVWSCGRTELQWPRSEDVEATLEVVPVYPLHAAWNAYVENDDAGAGWAHQDDVGCSRANAALGRRCIHGGEARHAVVPGLDDCSKYVIADSLGVWSWSCKAENGALDVYTAGLAPGKGLRDLVDEAGFRLNSLRVSTPGGVLVASSAPAVWGWTNDVLPLPDNSASAAVTLSSSGAIYVLAHDRASAGYHIDADGVAVVSLTGATLSWSGSGDNCDVNGERASPDHASLFCVGGNDFSWLEVTARGSATLDSHVDLVNSFGARLHAASLDTAVVGVSLSASHGNVVTDTLVTNTSEQGVLISGGSTWNLVQRVQALHVGGLEQGGIELTGDGTSYNRLHEVRVAGAQGYGIAVSAMAHDNWILDFEAHDNAATDPSAGIGLLGPRNKLVNGYVTNNGMWGVRVYSLNARAAYENTLVGVLTASGGTGVILQSESSRSTALNLTSVLGSEYGMLVNGADATLVANVMVVNNRLGFTVSQEDGSPVLGAELVDIMAIDNQTIGVPQYQVVVYDPGATAIRFDGHLWVGPTSMMCDVSPDRPGDGLVANTCTNDGLAGSSTYAGEASTAVLAKGLSSAAMFVGKVESDAASTDDTNGTAPGSALDGLDWWRFDNVWRAWGRDGAAYPAANQRGRCSGTTCRIWDWRLSANDDVARNRHGAFAQGACPASVHGDVVADDNQRLPYDAWMNAVELAGDGVGDDDGSCEAGEVCHNRFLLHATEVVMDAIGDDDGLCESNETCIYAPNVGAYQGDGDFTKLGCAFANGAVTNVIMHAYPQNGG